MRPSSSPAHRLRLAALLFAGGVIASLAPTPALAVDGGAGDGGPPKPLVPKGTCVTADCHGEVKASAVHVDKKLDCVACHRNVSDGNEKHAGSIDGFPPEQMCSQKGCHGEAQSKLLAGKHKDSVCESCHGAEHEGIQRFDVATCKSCHGDQLEAFDKSVHAKVDKPVTCVHCHGDMHEPLAKTDPLSPMSKVLQVSTCGECHDGEYVKAYRTSVHGAGVLRSGLAVAPTCSDCHGAHDIVKVKEAGSRLSSKNVTDTCGKCHTFIVSRWKGSAHGLKWQEQQKGAGAPGNQGERPAAHEPGEGHVAPQDGPVCTTCHPGHLTFDPMVYGNHLKMAAQCEKCHREESATYRDSFHGKAARLGFGAAATCADCHSPHEMLVQKDPRSTVHPKNLEKTCGKCHAKETSAAFVQFRSHVDPSNPKAGAIHYVWLFMTALLVGVLLFFAVHASLWLQRAIVALRRGEIHRPPKEGEIWVRRFRPVHMWIHVTIIVTFLLLAATGLPIKFSNVPWARAIEALFINLQVARWLHRIAGILSFGYGAAYLAYLVREIVWNGRRELLWGWQSMVPNKKDLVDLVHNFRWFLYLGKPPRLDRWAYWEKFDFFAVFWGIPVIGLSGLALWLPGLVTKVFPGWVLNLAYLIHSDEALLATGFIFVFHFFHTHMRPEAFPLDTVMFLGAVPLERFKEERPIEHERLERSGELARYLVPPPSERAIRRAYRFGTASLLVGLLLTGILVAAGFDILIK